MQNKVTKELLLLAKQNGGILQPAEVVLQARKSNSPLHEYFDWDDSIAAEKWRIEQAQHMIRAVVRIIEQTKKPVRVFVSLTPDRGKEGGYREIITVLRNPDQRQQLLRDAVSELESFKQKYSMLTELAAIFMAMKKVKSKLKK